MSIRPWGEFEIDDETGLPKVAEGQFWRVERVGGHVVVSLRERRRGWVSRKLATRTGDYATLTKGELLSYCAQALTNYREDQEKRHVATPKALLGDYPPKRLDQS